MATTTRRRRSSYRVLPGWLTVRRLALAGGGLVVLTAGLYGVRLALALAHISHENPVSAVVDVIKGKGASTIQNQVEKLDRINVAVYGYGGAGHDGPYLTDSIMVVSIQPRRGRPPQIAEISIPRDWYAPIQLGGGRTAQARINEAYQDGMQGQSAYPAGPAGAAAVADGTLERLLGIHIDHYVGVDFHAFESGVDSLGGIDLDVPHSFTDEQYPRGECGADGRGDCAYTTVHFDAGPQHMDGPTALVFARSRHSTDSTEGTDFARSRRQQLVLQAMREKVMSVGGFGHLPDLLNALGDHVVHDLSVGDGEALYDLVKPVDPRTVEHVSLDDTNFLYDCDYPRECGAAYLYPRDTSLSSIHHFVQTVFPDPGAVDERAPVTVLDGSDRGEGASGRWTTLLGEMGLASRDGGTAPVAPTTRVIDASGGRGAATARWLGEYFRVAPETPGAVTTPGSEAGDAVSEGGVTVILGQDEESAFVQPLGRGLSGAPASAQASSAPRQSRPASRTPAAPSPAPPPTPPQAAPAQPGATPRACTGLLCPSR